MYFTYDILPINNLIITPHGSFILPVIQTKLNINKRPLSFAAADIGHEVPTTLTFWEMVSSFRNKVNSYLYNLRFHPK